MRYLSTVYVRDHRARVAHRRGSLLVSNTDGSQRIPLEAVDAVVILGGAQITTQALKMSGAIRFVLGSSAGFPPVRMRASMLRARRRACDSSL